MSANGSQHKVSQTNHYCSELLHVATIPIVDRRSEDFVFPTWLLDLERQLIDIDPFEASLAERAAWEMELENIP